MSTASRQVWNWREDTPAKRREHLVAQRRRQGMVGGLVALAVGSVLNLVLGHVVLGRVLVAVGAVQAVVALWRPLALAAPLAWLRRFGQTVGTALTWVLLTPLWLLVFVPGGLWLRLRRGDPLQCKSLAAGLTAWIPRRRVSDAASAARHFLDEDRAARDLGRPDGALPAPGSDVEGGGGPA